MSFDEKLNERIELVPESMIENYRLLGLIESTSSGQLYEAQRDGLNKPLALKIVSAAVVESDVRFEERFNRQCAAISRITHEHMVTLYDSGCTSDGRFFYVTDLVQGTRLDVALGNEGQFSDARVLDIGLQLTALLSDLSKHSLSFRGLNLSDIVLKESGDVDVVKVVDLGLAKQQTTDASIEGGESHINGPRLELDLEQLSANFASADVNLVGGLLFKLLTGKDLLLCSNPPHELFSTQSPGSTRLIVGDDDHELKRQLRLIVARCLPDANSHYQTIDDLLDALSELQRHYSSRVLVPRSHPKRRGAQRMLLMLGAVSLVVTLVATAIAATSYFSGNSGPGTTTVEEKQFRQTIKDRYGRTLYASDASTKSECLREALNKRVNLAGAELRTLHLNNIQIQGVNLSGAHFDRVSFNNVTFTDTNLDGALFKGCKLAEAHFKKVAAGGAEFISCSITSSSFTDSKLVKAKFMDCPVGLGFPGISIKSCDLRGIKIMNARWTNSEIVSSMPDAEVSCHLMNCTIKAPSMKGANFSAATATSCRIVSPDGKNLRFKSAINTQITEALP